MSNRSLTRKGLTQSLRSLTKSQKRLLDLILFGSPAWIPLPGPQMMAYTSEADELFYGGAAGGGKTDLAIGLSLIAHRKSIIFRREFPQLRGIIDRFKEIIPSDSYNGQSRTFNLSDRTVELGACQYEKSKEKYKGRPHDLKIFDELPDFTETQFRFLKTWLRTSIPGQRIRLIGTGNPPTSTQGEWVIRYWAPWLDDKHPNPALPGELRWFATKGDEDIEVDGPELVKIDGEILEPRSRTFIPARVDNNPIYLATGYKAVLQALPEPLRSQMLYGDFTAGRKDHEWQAIPTEWVKLAQGRWKERQKPDTPINAIGVDVARGGKDKTVLALRTGTYFELIKQPGKATPDGDAIANLVISTIVTRNGGPSTLVNVDLIGVGSSGYDSTRKLHRNTYGINAAGVSTARDKSTYFGFANLRAEMYWKMREALDPKTGDDLALPPDREVLSDLCTPRYKVTSRGIQIEDKLQIIARIGRSPDIGDALVMSRHRQSLGFF